MSAETASQAEIDSLYDSARLALLDFGEYQGDGYYLYLETRLGPGKVTDYSTFYHRDFQVPYTRQKRLNFLENYDSIITIDVGKPNRGYIFFQPNMILPDHLLMTYYMRTGNDPNTHERVLLGSDESVNSLGAVAVLKEIGF